MHSSILIELKKFFLLAFVLVLLSIVMSMCVVGLLELQIAYASPYADIDVDTAYNMITNGGYPDLVVLDVRTKSEYDEGHIYGAVWIPHTELDARISELAGHENHEIIVYCRTGVRSVNASEILDSHNFTKVYNLLGGILEWQSASYSVWIATVHNLNTTFNYDTIQAAIDAPQTLDWHTILVDAGTYYEYVVVNKSISLIGENKSTTILDGKGAMRWSILIVNDNVHIEGFAIRNTWTQIPSHGIELHSHNNTISGNIVSGSSGGILFTGSTGNIISHNVMTKIFPDFSIELHHSDGNTIYDNIIEYGWGGISLVESRGNAVKGNTITRN